MVLIKNEFQIVQSNVQSNATFGVCCICRNPCVNGS